MDEIKHILLILLLLLGGCSADEENMPVPLSWEEEPLEFRTIVGAKESGAMYESEYFVPGDEIRIFCPVSYSTPDFTDNAPGMFIYEYKMDKEGAASSGWSDWPYIFQPKDKTKGFDWRTLQPTSIYYIFEAIHFPGKHYLEKVPTRQDLPYEYDTSISGLEAADMLVAHHRQTLDKKGSAVQLTFHHAFAMVEVTVELPVSDTPVDGPFPKGALKEVYMKQMLTRYTVNYSEVIDNDGLRPVWASEKNEIVADNDTARKDVYMKEYVLPEDDVFFVETNNAGEKITYQRYVYQGIVPEQNIRSAGQDFLFFKVNRHDGIGQETLYRFKLGASTKPFSLKASHILSIKLRIDSNLNEVTVVTAEVKPWVMADGEFDLFPVK